ncbi:hypothetical protein [Kitasatospora viridis]|uniref:hypothetical protein n=1 Tax=Kitasatospora viridis TaxID=281105 RepID=UPI001FEA6BDF|nr:hypothetical protein [Kitasatospora viridis]
MTIDDLTAVGLSVTNGVTVRLSDGTTVTTTQYTFTPAADQQPHARHPHRP